MVTLFEKDICPLLERSPGGEDKWNRISVRISDHQTISLCVTAYGVALGIPGSSMYRIIERVKNGEATAWSVVSKTLSKQNSYKKVDWTGASGRSEQFMDRLTIDHYVESLIWDHEMNPAPGAARCPQQTSVTKQNWKRRFEDMSSYFERLGLQCLGQGQC